MSASDFENLTDIERALLEQDMDDGLLGWGFIKIGVLGVVGPPIDFQPWIPKEYTPERGRYFWKEVLGEGTEVNNAYIENAVDIVVPRGLVKLQSLSADQSADGYHLVQYNSRSTEHMILANGYSRLNAAQAMLFKGWEEGWLADYEVWLARFFDLGRTILLPPSPVN